MKEGLFVIEENVLIARDVYKMRLVGDTSDVTTPGQFVNIALENRFLRRPISVCDYDESSLTLVYKVVGEGTGEMARMRKGQTLDLLTGLGNGFSPVLKGKTVVIGGGLGIAPLYALVKRLDNPLVVLGAKTKDDLFLIDEFRSVAGDIFIATEDGSMGKRGFVTDIVREMDFDCFYTCGPLPMMKALVDVIKSMSMAINGQLSLEERMGCGFGACMGCSVQTAHGAKRVCREGPVFNMEDLMW